MNIPASLTKCQRIWFLSPVFVVFLVGCSKFSELTSSPPPKPISPTAQQRLQEAEGYQSLAKSIEKLDANTLRAYVDALTKPSNSGFSQQKATWKTVTASDLVSNHPAWILAERLESGGVFPLAARDLKIVPRSASGTGSVETFEAESKAVKNAIASQKISGSSTPEGLEKAQLGALDSFNRAWSERQFEIRRSEERLRERELEDDIREQTRIQIRTIALQTVPSDVALELSNLRLQLLRNIAVAPSQRQAARQRIAQIEEDLQKIWREQIALQERLVNESLQASPSKLRNEGRERIRATMRELAAKDALERRQALSEFEAVIGRDFNRAKELSLALFLPPAIVPDEIRASFFEQSNITESSGKSVSVKPQNSITQQNPTQKLAEIGPIPSSEINRLRQIALRDAGVWAQAANQLKSPMESKIQREPE
jgi:hypothetical protein